MIKRPMVWLFASLLAGMLLIRLREKTNAPPIFLYGLGGILFLLLIFLIWSLFIKVKSKQTFPLKRKPYFLFLCPLLFVLGMLRMEQAVSPWLLEPVLTGDGCRTTVQGSVVSVTEKEDYEQILLTKVQVLNDGQWSFCEDLLATNRAEKTGDFLTAGQTVCLTGKLRLFSKATNPGQFDAYSYYRSEGIAYQLLVEQVQKKASAGSGVNAGLQRLKKRMGSVYEQACGEEISGCLYALVLGDKSEMLPEQKESFQRTGVFHMFAISGMHFSILTGVLGFLFQKLGFSRRVSLLQSGGLCFFYWLLIGQGVSASRAFVMFLCGAAALLFLRGYDSGSALSLAGILLLLEQPLRLEQASFLMSFGAVCGILLIYQPCVELENKRPQKKRGRLGTLLLSVRHSLLLSFSVELVLLPVLLVFTCEFSFAGLLLNLIFLPLLPAAYLLSFAGGLAGLLSLTAAKLFLLPVSAILSFYTWASEKMEQLSFLSYTPGCPDLFRLVVYMLLLVFLILLLRWYKKSFVLLFSVFLFFLLIPTPFADCWVTILDVGQGDAVVIGDTAGKTIVIDGGSSTVQNVAKNRILPFLKWKGVAVVDLWMITHADSDHYSGLQELLEKKNMTIRIKKLGLPLTQKNEEAIQLLAELAEQKDIPVSYMSAGDFLSFDGRYTCIHPEAKEAEGDKNSQSLVLLMKYKDFTGIFTGDLDEAGEQRLISEEVLMPVTLLKVGHHGSKTSSSTAFLEQLHPALSVISVGENNRYHHPAEQVLKRLWQVGSTVCCTKDTGAVTIHTDGKQVRLETFR